MAKLPPFRFGASESKTEGQDNAPLVEQPTSTQQNRPKRRGRPPSIGIRLGQDGKADISNMSPEQVDKIRSAVAGTSLLSQDEKKAIEEAKKAKIAAYKPLVVPLIKMLGHIEAQLVQRTRKCTDQQAELFLYTDSEVSVLQEPFAAVVAKHSGRLERFQEETTLALYMLQTFHAKTVMLNKAMAEQQTKVEKVEEKRTQVESISDLESKDLPHVRANGSTVPLK